MLLLPVLWMMGPMTRRCCMLGTASRLQSAQLDVSGKHLMTQPEWCD